MARAIATLVEDDEGRMRVNVRIRRGEMISYFLDSDQTSIAYRHYGDDVIAEFEPADQFARIAEVPDLATGLLVPVEEGVTA